MRRVLLVGMVFPIYGCTTIVDPPQPPPPAERFQCLGLPSSGYVPGTVLRTTVQEDGKTIDTIEYRTIAYKPFFKPDEIGSFADYSSTIDHGLSGKLTTDNFRKLGFKGEASIRAKYDVVLKTKSNTHLLVDDTVIAATLNELNRRPKEIIASANYYIVKEALASDELLYEAKPDFGASINAKVEAIDADANFTIDLAKGSSSISGSQKKLVACIVMEPLDVSKGGDGPPLILRKNTAPVATEPEYRQLSQPAEIVSLQ